MNAHLVAFVLLVVPEGTLPLLIAFGLRAAGQSLRLPGVAGRPHGHAFLGHIHCSP